jgi:hypothetical protein
VTLRCPVALAASIATIVVPGKCEEFQKVSPYQLKSDRAAFNHRLVEVTTFVSHGFEGFTVQEPICDSKFDIWLEYGGKSVSGTVYCCGGAGERTAPKKWKTTLSSRRH